MPQAHTFQSLAAQFSDHLQTNKHALLGMFVDAVDNDKQVPSADALTRQELLDHFGGLINQLSGVLSNYELGDVSKLPASIAQEHGEERRVKGYTITESLHEIERLRLTLSIDVLHGFANSFSPPLDYMQLAPVSGILHAFFRHLTTHSVARFETEKDNEVAGYFQQLTEANERLQQTNEMLQRREAQITKLSRTDALTNVGNRRALAHSLRAEVTRTERYQSSLSALMLDLDHFKSINDDFGHSAGDEVLKATGALLKSCCRQTDSISRAGGEEFVVLLPHTQLEQAAELAERIRKMISELRFPEVTRSITASIGVAELVPGEKPAAMLRRADAAMYEAKTSGRNQVMRQLSSSSPG